MNNIELLRIQLKYLDRSIEYTERELAARREYRERLQMELNRACRLEREELQNVTEP